MTTSVETVLLGLARRTDDEAARGFGSLDSDAREVFRTQVRRHGMLGRARAALPLDDALSRQWGHDIVTTTRLLQDLEAVVSAVRSADVPAAVVKGPALSVLWPAPAERLYSDLDLLVHPKDAAHLLHHLVAQGVVRLALPVPDALDLARRGNQALSLDLGHGGQLDLHVGLLHAPGFPVDDRALLGSCVERTLEGVTVPVLGIAETVVVTALHACLNGGHRLSWHVDLAATLTAPGVEPAEVRACAARHGLVLPVSVMLDRAVALGVLPRRVSEGVALPRCPWRTAMRALHARQDLLWAPGRRRSGGSVVGSTRRTSTASARSLVRPAARELPGRRRQTSS